jgi:uridine phosphorylase
VPERLVLTHQTSLFRSLAPRWRTRSLKGLSAELRHVPVASGRLAAGKLGVGAPATAILLEELAVLGVKEIVAIDVAGSIDARLRSGSIVLAEAAICGDGTSPHYVPGEAQVVVDAGLATRLADAFKDADVALARGSVWSTDAPFRETPSLLETMRGSGASLVDMETAALYAAGNALGIATAAVLVVADETFEEWQPPADMHLVQAQLARAATVARRCLLS